MTPILKLTKLRLCCVIGITGITLYRFLLDMIYVMFVVPNFGYTYGGFLEQSSLQTFVLSYVILFCSFLFINPIIFSKKRTISSLVITALYLLSFVPFTTGVFAGTFSDTFVFSFIMYWLCLVCVERNFLKAGIHIECLALSWRVKRQIFWSIVIFSACVVLYISYVYTGFRLNFSILNVYDLRDEARGYNLPVVLTYFLSWIGMLNPVIVGYAFIRKKYVLTAFVLVVEFFHFGIGGHKSVLLMPYFVILSICMLKGISIRKIKVNLIWAFVLMCSFSVIEVEVYDTLHLINILVRRVIFVPMNLHKAYFEFFLINEPDYFCGSFLRHFGFETQYVSGIANEIGEYLGYPEMSANNGLFSDAFSNLGYVGIVVMPIFLILVLRCLDSVLIKLPLEMYFVVLVPVVFDLLSTSLLTVILTHGLLITLLLLCVMNLNDES